MISYFKNAILICGLAIPIFIMVIIAAVVLFFSAKVDKNLKTSRASYEKAQKEQKEVAKLQAEVGQSTGYLKQWEDNLNAETRGTFLEHWKDAEKKFSGKEFSRFPHNWINKTDGLGKDVNQSASQVEMNFSATFSAMQRALIQVESTLPQMQLDSLSMTPDSKGERLNFKTQFTVWTKN